jgi:adenylate cyclase
VTEDLTADLSRIPDSFVISRHTAFTYRNRSIGTKQIGHELGVRYVVEGSVRRSGNRVRVNAQLVDAELDTHLWAERYDRSRADLFELQDEIVTAIAGAIEPELLKFERGRIAALPQQSDDAYELYQRGMFHHYRQNKADNLKAQAYFRRALVSEPHSSQATAALSIALTIAAYLSWAENPERNYQEAFELGERAVALDERYPNAHFALALICMWTGRTERAAAEFEEAIKLNPSFAAAHAVLGVVFTLLGNPAAGVESIEKGLQLSPRDPRLFIWLSGLAAAHYQLRHYSDAVEIGRRSWALNRNYITGLTYVVAGLAQLGKREEARTVLAELRELDPSLAAARTTLQRLYKDQAGVDHLRDGLRKAGFE